MEALVSTLPHVNASLNAVATVLLIVGYRLIKQSQRVDDPARKVSKERAHKIAMLSCFAVSIAFLASYLTYHWAYHEVTGNRGKPFTYDVVAIRYIYYTILISHVVLAATVPFLALATIYFGVRDNRRRHVALARWTFPIWLYVSVTGVVVYFMLYWLQ